jgi:acetyl-CoA acetyltransferase
VDLHAVTEDGRASGVAHGEALVAFAEAVVSLDVEAITRARERVIAALGVEAMVDAAAVISNFERMVRIADGTGIPLGEMLESRSRAVVEELRLDRLRSSGGG